jgi:hypothetical protein
MAEENKITTIKIQKQTKSRLDKLKEHERETYEQILRKMLFILNTTRKNPESATKIIKRIDKNIKRKSRYTKVNKPSIKPTTQQNKNSN